ncbi:MAG: hypothetical protein M1150_02790 [Patescibacteria group bacterium]|nr:hypothetical protein [Patescibacteria group bacterium]
MGKTQATPGQIWEMIKALGDRLPKELGQVGYHQDPRWYNERVAELVRLSRNSPEAQQIERILSSGALTVESLSNPYANEKVKPTRSYPNPWPVLTPEQWAEGYQKAYPDLDASCILELESGLVIPSWCDQRVYWRPRLDRFGQVIGVKDPYGKGYGPCLEWLLNRLAEIYGEGFCDYRKGALTEKHVRLESTTRQYLEWIDSQTKGDYVPEIGSLGGCYAGYSVRNCREDTAKVNKDRWAWPAFIGGSILLVDHVRLGRNGLLNIDFPGDEYDPDGRSQFGGYCLRFRFHDRLKFSCRWIGYPDEYWGSAVGFRRLRN